MTPERIAWAQAAQAIALAQKTARLDAMVRAAAKLPPLSDERRAELFRQMAERKP